MMTEEWGRKDWPAGAQEGTGDAGGIATRDSEAVWRAAGDGAADERLANALGWLSLGLGLAGIAAPGQVARMIGVEDDSGSRAVLRAVGLREIASGVGILSRRRPAGWVWSRVAGDVMDLALLGTAFASGNSERGRLAATTAAIAGVTAVDFICGQQLSRDGAPDGASAGQVVRVKSITVNRSPEEVYGFWRRLSNLPRFMGNLESVEELDERRSHWRAKGPAGTAVEWDAEITEERSGELIAWQSLPGSDLRNWGRVRFQPAPGGRGTELQVEIEYKAPAGEVGARLARLLGKEPGQELAEDLRRFKQVMETGEVTRSDASLGGLMFPQRPGQPQGGAR